MGKSERGDTWETQREETHGKVSERRHMGKSERRDTWESQREEIHGKVREHVALALDVNKSARCFSFISENGENHFKSIEQNIQQGIEQVSE